MRICNEDRHSSWWIGMASSKKMNTSNFASGHDRYLALQKVSSRILNRAGILNNLEEMELDRRTKLLELEEDIKKAQHDAIKKRLCGNLKDCSSHRGTSRNGMRKSKSENDKLSTRGGLARDDSLRPDGRRVTGRVYAHTRLTDAMVDLGDRHRLNERLLREARRESEAVIDRRLTTDQILNADHLPLSERLVITNTEKFQSVIARARAVNVVNKFRSKILERKEREKGLKLRKSSRGKFTTQVTKTNIAVSSDLLTE